MISLETPWHESTFIAFDTETTGKYPLQDEVCEVAAVKWSCGKVIDTFQSFLRPSHPMSDEVIKIHGITNDMVKTAPSAQEVFTAFYQFINIEKEFLIAHHAPFDMGFIALEWERLGLSLPKVPVFCSSLLSRRWITQSPNHRLQTLIKHLGLKPGAAHRALDDSKACLEIGLECFKRSGLMTVAELLKSQTKNLLWENFMLGSLRSQPPLREVILAIEQKVQLEMVYEGGSRPGKMRTVSPMGLVRSPDGDFLVACEKGNAVAKRYFLRKISQAKPLLA